MRFKSRLEQLGGQSYGVERLQSGIQALSEANHGFGVDTLRERTSHESPRMAENRVDVRSRPGDARDHRLRILDVIGGAARNELNGKTEARGEFAPESSCSVIGGVKREASSVWCVYFLSIGIEICDVSTGLGSPHLEYVVDLGS